MMFASYRFGYRHLLLVLLPLIALVSACGDECGVTCRTPEPTLENIWPNEDGTFWTYDYTWRTWDTDVRTYPEQDSLPPVPSLYEIEEVLGHHPIGANADTVEATYSLEFKGETTTGSGVTAQNLEESVSGAGGPVIGRAGELPGFIDRLRRARPDLGNEIDMLYPQLRGPFVPGTPPAPILLHGGAWEKTDRWIGTYGDADTLLAWKYLEADLAEGHEFTHQLIPSVADDVYLYARVIGCTVVRSPEGRFWKAVECLYVVDYGPFQLQGEYGPEGWRQYYDYGKVTYVPEIGPVYCYERTLIAVGETLGVGYGDIEVDLTVTNLDVD